MPNININRKVILSSTFKYDLNALVLFNAIGDVPTYAKIAANNRIIAAKANGTWNTATMWYMFLPSNDREGFLYNAKTATKMGAIYSNSSLPVAPYDSRSMLGGTQGLIFNNGDYHIKTTWLPSDNMILNDSAFAVGLMENISASAQLNFGVLESATSSCLFQKKNTSNQMLCDMYGPTTTSGRALQSSTSGNGGVFIANRRNTTDFKVYRNDSVIASTANAQGTLPTKQWYVRGFNNNDGAYSASDPKNEPMAFLCVYGTGLTTAQVTQENIDWTNFSSAMKRETTYSYRVVFDGNSHFTHQLAQQFRSTQYYTGIPSSISWRNIGVGGQTTTTMTTNQATNLYPLFGTIFGTNICVVTEATNAINAGDSAATAYSQIETYCNNVKNYWTTNGITGKIIVVPVFARRFTSNTARIITSNDYNVLLAAGYTAFADALVDFPNVNYWDYRSNYASDAAYITHIQSLCDNTTYFYDETHLTALGYKEMGQKIAEKILTIL